MPVHSANQRIVEIRTYRLHPGSGPRFHRLLADFSVPLHHAAGIDVVCHAASVEDADRHVLVRAFDSLDQMRATLAAFYASPAWRVGPREEILALIAADMALALSMDAEAIAGHLALPIAASPRRPASLNKKARFDRSLCGPAPSPTSGREPIVKDS